MIRRLKKNEYEIKRALSIKQMIQDIEVSDIYRFGNSFDRLDFWFRLNLIQIESYDT